MNFWLKVEKYWLEVEKCWLWHNQRLGVVEQPLARIGNVRGGGRGRGRRKR